METLLIFMNGKMEEAEMSNKAKYYGVFVEIFEVDEKVLDENFNFKDVENWDSLTHLSLITALEDSFDVMFETDDILHFGGFMNGMKILERYGVDFSE